MACRGRYCDDLKLYCARVDFLVTGGTPETTYRAFVRSAGTLVRSRWFSEGDIDGYSLRLSGPIPGIVCRGRYCDEKELVGVQRDGVSAVAVTRTGHWTMWFSDDTSATWADCPVDMAVNEMQCMGRYCDELPLSCGQMADGFRVDVGDIRVVNWFSEEDGERLCPDGYYFWGMACREFFCDELKLNCARVDYDPQVNGKLEEFMFIDIDLMPGTTLSTNNAPSALAIWVARDWMRKFDGSRRLTELAIPGTHDSAELHGGSWCECQSWSLEEQMGTGVRYLDIRARRTGTSFAIHHGACYQHLMLGDVLIAFGQFLQMHPSETIFMHVKEEHTPADGAESFGDTWNTYMERFGHLFAGNFGTTVPTLDEVRGKIPLLWNNNEISGRGLQFDDPATDVQDMFKIKYYSMKTQEVKDYLEKAMTPSSRLVLNHLSGIMGTIPNPKSVAEIINPRANWDMRGFPGRNVFGVIIMDFPGKKIIYCVLRSSY